MILKLLQVIKEGENLIEKTMIDRDLITELYQDLSSIDHMIEGTIDSNNAG